MLNLFEKYKINQEFDMLSIDIDYNDFYIMNEILKKYKPKIIVTEYNSKLKFDDKIVKYNPDYCWDGTDYFGASIYSFYKLGRKYNYSLVYAENMGVNIFFVRDDLVCDILKNKFYVNNIYKIYKSPKYGEGYRNDPKNRKYITFNKFSKKINYDFIEIGTSDFDTLIENANESMVGLSIEPIKFYLDKLPKKKNVKKVNCAICEDENDNYIYYYTDDIIKKYNWPDFLKGCNKVNDYHNYHFEYGIEHVTKEKINNMSFKQLKIMYMINKIDYLKIDTEGYDIKILESILDYYGKNNPLLPTKILFESNELYLRKDVSNIIMKLIEYGYILVETDFDTIVYLKTDKPFVFHIEKQKHKCNEYECINFSTKNINDYIKEKYNWIYNKILKLDNTKKELLFKSLFLYKNNSIYSNEKCFKSIDKFYYKFDGVIIDNQINNIMSNKKYNIVWLLFIKVIFDNIDKNINIPDILNIVYYYCNFGYYELINFISEIIINCNIDINKIKKYPIYIIDHNILSQYFKN